MDFQILFILVWVMRIKVKRWITAVLLVFIGVSTYGQDFTLAQADSVIRNSSDYNQSVGVLRNFPDEILKEYLSSERSKTDQCMVFNALCWRNFYSNPQQAMEYAKAQLTIAEELNKPVILIASYDNVSYLLMNKSEYSEAIEFMLKSLKAKEDIGDKAGISVSISGLAGTYYQMKNFELALDYFNQSWQIEVQNNDSTIEGQRRKARLLGNIGQCKIELGLIEEGISALDEAIERYIESDIEKDAALHYANLGLAYFQHKDDAQQALNLLARAEELYKINEEFSGVDYSGLASLQSTMTEIYIGMGDVIKARAYGKKGVFNAEKSGDKKQLLASKYSLAKAFFKTGEYKLAYTHFEEAFKLKDEIFTEQSAEQIAEMQTKYDTEKKEAENELLKAVNERDQAELKQKSFQQKILTVGLFVMVIVAGYVAYSLNQKKKTNKLLNEQNEQISSKNQIIEEKNKDITDSINYAKRIQNAILPEEGVLSKHFESFIYYRPKDIVSGDFYWVKETDNRIFFSVVDCTGHGVPGAFMSIIGYNSLNRIVEESEGLETGVILDQLNSIVLSSIANQSAEGISIRDGMDLNICCYDKKSKVLEYSGAHNSLYIIRKTEREDEFGVASKMEGNGYRLFEIKADKMAIGGDKNELNYKTHKLNVHEKDTIYLFSDGYADQFGGPKGKKFMYKRFKELLLNIQPFELTDQMQSLDRTMKDWQGELDQLDDICVMGVRF